MPHEVLYLTVEGYIEDRGVVICEEVPVDVFYETNIAEPDVGESCDYVSDVSVEGLYEMRRGFGLPEYTNDELVIIDEWATEELTDRECQYE